MSLIKPLEVDFVDAHDREDQDGELRSFLETKSQKRDSNGKLTSPWRFESPRGFFKQRDPQTNELEFNYITDDFGLLVGSWADLQLQLAELNRTALPNESYKLLFLLRHGQGYHNYAVSKYGIKLWDDHWSHIEGDGEIVWGPDPFLTELGENQARENNKAWKQQILKGAPIPSKFYSSPFTRSCQTLVNTWLDITLTESAAPKKPLIKELIREQIGVHLCDKRSTKSVIESRFSKYGFEIEENFTEKDELYKDDVRETVLEQVSRLHDFLQFLFEKEWDGDSVSDEKDVYVSVTSHAGTTRSLLLALGHNRFTIAAGGMIPVVVKGVRELD